MRHLLLPNWVWAHLVLFADCYHVANVVLLMGRKYYRISASLQTWSLANLLLRFTTEERQLAALSEI